MKKNVVAGLGEIGSPILLLLSKKHLAVGYDIDKKIMDEKKFQKYESVSTSFLHICIPFSKNFVKNVKSLYSKFKPEIIVIHSTTSPGTTKKLQQNLPVPVIVSPIRGVHKRMLYDLRRYAKFFSMEPSAPKAKLAAANYTRLMKKCGVKTKKISKPITLELAKLVVDTSYYGWLINYAQISNLIAQKYGVDYDEMWSFADEIEKFVGNRPKMFPGNIGGHCVIPNLELVDEKELWQIDKINNFYVKKVKNLNSILKKYVKGKQSYDKN